MSDKEWDAAKLGGSMKRKIVNPDLAEERAKCAFDQAELACFTLTKYVYDKSMEVHAHIERNPSLNGEAEEYEMTREELIANFWKKIKIMNEVDDGKWMLEGAEHTKNIYQWDIYMQSINPL